jgi:hypothetical protein
MVTFISDRLFRFGIGRVRELRLYLRCPYHTWFCVRWPEVFTNREKEGSWDRRLSLRHSRSEHSFTLRYCWRWFGHLVFNDQLTPPPVYEASVCAIHCTLTSVQRIAKTKHIHFLLNYIICCAPDHSLQQCRPISRNPADWPSSFCNGGFQCGQQNKELLLL